ncbi:MAG: phosphotransferase [Woeseiaceae bacterium]|nr:phosphotransferase [Woeseiaceae bacterium]
MTSSDGRLRALAEWLTSNPALGDGSLAPASGDASFRRYFRVTTSAATYIAMDAPPPQEDCRPFVAVAGYLEAIGVHAPRVLDADLDRGFLLLTDLGATQYLDVLCDDADRAPGLYDDALTALLRVQQRGTAFQSSLPPYDQELLTFELSLFHDWLCGTHLGIDFDTEAESAWQRTCDLLIDNALQQPQVFVHRDYHSRNLMVVPDTNPGILDFQDAVEGPLTYDLVSLLKDCYIRWPAGRVRRWARQFYDGLAEDVRSQADFDRFWRWFELMGVQRHLKAAGIFARLNHRDGKAAYIGDVPRTLSYITELAPHYDELAFVIELIETRVLPPLEKPS